MSCSPQLSAAKSSCASSLQENKENELLYFIVLPPPRLPRAGQSGATISSSEFLIAKLNASAPSAACWDGWRQGAHSFISS